MILCVSPNPALDRTLLVPDFAAGKVLRAQSALAAAGGKGINVARAVRNLEGEALCSAFLGGTTGRYIAELTEKEQIPGQWTWIDGETRTCIIVADAQTGEATVVNEQGPHVTSEDWSRFETDVSRLADDRIEFVCFSGSLPPGSPSDAYPRLVQAVLRKGKQVWVDTSGAPLSSVLRIPDIGIKVNGDEVGVILGRKIGDPDTALSAARELKAAGPHTVVLTLGAKGAVMAYPTGEAWASPPVIKVVDPIGSGDSFLAGLVTSISNHCAPDEALRRAVAAGAANALTIGGGQFSLEVFNNILAGTTLHA